MEETIYILIYEGKEIFRSNDINQCYYKLLDKQPNSTQHALKFEGWSIITEEEFNKKIAK